MDAACQNCASRLSVRRCELEFERLSGPVKTVRMRLCEVCADSVMSEDWVRELRH